MNHDEMKEIGSKNPITIFVQQRVRKLQSGK